MSWYFLYTEQEVLDTPPQLTSPKKTDNIDGDDNISSPQQCLMPTVKKCKTEDDSAPTIKKCKAIKTEDDSVPLPDPFPLPKYYPQDIEVALRRKIMSTKEKSRVISEVASAMLRFKRYPVHDDYLCVARSIVDKYPFFKSSDSKPYVSFQIY